MKINAALPILISLLPTALSACASTAAARNDAPTVAEQPPATATPDKVGAVVRVDVPGRGNGSGVVISNDGHVLTCAHVVVGADSIRVTAEKDGRPLFFTASIVAIDRTRDLAVLLTRDREPLPVTAAFANSADIVAGHDVYGAGFPEGRGQSVASGTIRRFPFSVDMRPAENTVFAKGVLADLKGAGGISGGGVFSGADGKLIGIHKMSFLGRDGRPKSVLISIEEIVPFLDAHLIPYLGLPETPAPNAK